MNSALQKETEVCSEGNDWLPPFGRVSVTLYINAYYLEGLKGCAKHSSPL